jgi:uncharacterized protein YggE
MRKAWFISLLAIAPAFGQLESNTVTVSAARSTYLQPDQVVFGLSVTSPVSTNLDQVIAALSGLGITSANLTGVGSNATPPTLQWNFTLAVPIPSLTATIGAISKLEQNFAQNNNGLTLTFSVNGTQVSQQLQESQSCSNTDLIADATAQAQKLAAAAGMTLGPILYLSNAPSAPTFGVPTIVARLGTFAEFLQGSVSSPATCSLVVTFRLQL